VELRQRKIGSEERAIGPSTQTTKTCRPGPAQAACNDLRAVLTQGGEGMDEKSSWMRFAVTIAIDWRFVLAVVFLVLALLLK
jgi:hypothetical protein